MSCSARATDPFRRDHSFRVDCCDRALCRDRRCRLRGHADFNESFGLLIDPEVIAPIASIGLVPQRVPKDVDRPVRPFCAFPPIAGWRHLHLFLDPFKRPMRICARRQPSSRKDRFLLRRMQASVASVASAWHPMISTHSTCPFSSNYTSRYRPGDLYAYCRVSVLSHVLFPSLLVMRT